MPTTQTPEEKQIEERAEGYVRHYVLCCQSSLVDELLGRGDIDGFMYEDIENTATDPSGWDIEQCREWIDERHSKDDGPQRADYVTQEADDEFEEEIDEDKYLEDMQEFIQDNAEPAEIFEWWFVDRWLCEQLREIGECVLDNDYGYWWGRCCTGQGMIQDGVFQCIARKFA